jgi:hypothetical protein
LQLLAAGCILDPFGLVLKKKSAVSCKERLGGLLKHYYRKAGRVTATAVFRPAAYYFAHSERREYRI